MYHVQNLIFGYTLNKLSTGALFDFVPRPKLDIRLYVNVIVQASTLFDFVPRPKLAIRLHVNSIIQSYKTIRYKDVFHVWYKQRARTIFVQWMPSLLVRFSVLGTICQGGTGGLEQKVQ